MEQIGQSLKYYNILERKQQQKLTINSELTEKLQQDEKYVQYNEWLISNGSIYPSVNFPTVFGSDLVGAAAKVDIPSSKVTLNQSYIFVPYRVIITPTKARQSKIGFIFGQHPSWFEGDGRELDNILYVFLIYEKLRKEESFWFPYFQVIDKIETILDWSNEELDELHDPFIINDAKKMKKDIYAQWRGLKQVLDKYPTYFPQDQNLQETFLWAYKLVTTRSFAQEDGMIIPLADNFNHIDVYISYETKSRQSLETYSTQFITESDYQDFLNESQPPNTLMNNRFYMNKLERFFEFENDGNQLQKIEYIWDLDDIVDEYQSSTDDEELRNDDETEDEYEDLEEEGGEVPDIDDENDINENCPDRFFMLTTGKNCSFKQGDQVFNCYGRVNNHDLMLDYGFAYQFNIYDSFLFRIWKSDAYYYHGLITIENILLKEYKKGNPNAHLSECADIYQLKYNKLNTKILDYYRNLYEQANLFPYQEGDIYPNLRLEQGVVNQVLDDYYSLMQRFLTTSKIDKNLKSLTNSHRLVFAIDYRSNQRRILKQQISYLEYIKRLLQKLQDGTSFKEAHLPVKKTERLLEIYPLKDYLREIENS